MKRSLKGLGESVSIPFRKFERIVISDDSDRLNQKTKIDTTDL